jgi:hypothetical protein
MLPQTDDGPSHRTKPAVIPRVPLSRLRYFHLPEIGNFVLPHGKSVAVPKVAIKEDNYASSGENDVRLTR